MQCLDVSLQENDKTQPENRGRPKVLPIFFGILFIFAFAGGFINGYSFGSHSSHKNGDAASIYLNFPPAASAESAASQNGNDYEPVMQAVLSNNEYIVYDALVDSVIRVAPQSSFTMPSATTVSMERIIEITKIVQNNPEFFWVEAMTWITWTDNADTTRTYTVSISYNMDAQTKILTQNQIEAVVDPILASASCRNASEAAAYVNEYLASRVTYAKQKPCVLCIDEIDTIAMRRGLNNDIGEMNRVVISLMQELDQLPNDLIIVATTNRYDQLDSALVRRFTVCQKVDAYNREDAVRLLRMFFDFAETKMTDDQLHEWVEKRFPNTTAYYPSALTNAATQYLVDSIIASTMNPDDAQPEQTNKQVYILYEETPDCMGSGSTSREVAKTTSFPQALEMLKKGTGNTLVKRTRINGTLVETYWNEFSRQFE